MGIVNMIPNMQTMPRVPMGVQLPAIPVGARAVLPMDVPSDMIVSRPYRESNTGFDIGSIPRGEMIAPAMESSRTFSGADIRCAVHVLGNGGQSRPVVIANAQTISYSIHREKTPVRALGHTYPVGFARHGRTIGGSIIFTLFNREVLWELIQSYEVDVEWNDGDKTNSSFSPMLDQLPPFDITVTFANEHGDVANLAIYGVELVDEGTVMSIDDLIVEKTCSFVARDIDMVRPYRDAPNFRAFGKDVTTEAITSEDVNTFLDSLRRRRDVVNRGSVNIGDSVYAYDIPYDYAIFGDRSNDVSRDVIEYMSSVVYAGPGGVRWFGQGSTRGDINPTACEFIPSLGKYPPWSLNGVFRVHTEALVPGTIDEITPSISPNYLLQIGTDGVFICTRDTLEVQ